MMGKLAKSQFRFRRNETVGAEGAEQDAEYLEDCYYDRGDLDLLRDPQKPNCIVVGRTGSGKTALLKRLADSEENVVELQPDSLSLHYLSDSSVLRRLEELGVNLSLFYKLLWRHVLAVELIKTKYGMRTESQAKTFMQSFLDLIRRDRAKERAINYLVEWGKTFWADTEYRVREVTSKLESEVKTSVGAKLAPYLEGTRDTARKLSVEEKGDVAQRAQQAVNALQVKELTNVLKILAEDIFNSQQPRYYVTVDRLDEDWVDDGLRYRLIKALIETIKEVNQRLQSVKVVVAIRRDLLDRVIQQTRDAGFQEEKYHPLYLDLRWTREQMFEMLDRRVNKLVRRQYTAVAVTWSDLLPQKILKKQRADDYLIERTMYRPRDLIVFFNYCIAQAVGKPEITAKMVLHAEGEYSHRRLQSLRDEWDVDYPGLLDFVELLKKRPARFPLHTITTEEVTDRCLAVATKSPPGHGGLTDWAIQVAEGRLEPVDFRARIVSAFYRTGLVGLKLETFVSDSWSFLHDPAISEAQVRDGSTVIICPVFFRALGVTPPDKT